MITGILIEAAIKSAIILLALLTGFAYLTLLERRFLAALQARVGPNRVGPWGLLQPAADGLKLFFKEDIVPANADKVIFALAPALTALPALIILAVVPVGDTIIIPEVVNGVIQTGANGITLPFKNLNIVETPISLGLADINVGVLYILAVTSIAVYGIVLAGWSSANKYAMMGGLRSAAQMVSYELSMGLSIIVPILLAGSMSLGDIIDGQARVWYFFLNPVAALIFIITTLAEVNRAPFDLPEAEQELTAGYHVEYSGMKFAMFYMGEYIKMIGVSVITATLFFGGYRLFGIEEVLPILGPLILFGKVLASLLVMIWIRATLPRFRYDRLMAFGWKILLPLSLASVVVTAIALAFGPQAILPLLVVSAIAIVLVILGTVRERD
jgi:NADH-quinone oxidoreductase subunit H